MNVCMEMINTNYVTQSYNQFAFICEGKEIRTQKGIIVKIITENNCIIA